MYIYIYNHPMDSIALNDKKRSLHQTTQRSVSSTNCQPVRQMMGKCSSRRTNVERPSSIQHCLRRFGVSLKLLTWISKDTIFFLFRSGQFIRLLEYTDGPRARKDWVFAATANNGSGRDGQRVVPVECLDPAMHWTTSDHQGFRDGGLRP